MESAQGQEDSRPSVPRNQAAKTPTPNTSPQKLLTTPTTPQPSEPPHHAPPFMTHTPPIPHYAPYHAPFYTPHAMHYYTAPHILQYPHHAAQPYAPQPYAPQPYAPQPLTPQPLTPSPPTTAHTANNTTNTYSEGQQDSSTHGHNPDLARRSLHTQQ